MTRTPTLTLNYPKKPDTSIKDFIEGNNGTSKENTIPKKIYPWEEPYIREDVYRSVQLRLTEPLFLKLQYIREFRKITNQSIWETFITPFIEEEIEKIKAIEEEKVRR